MTGALIVFFIVIAYAAHVGRKIRKDRQRNLDIELKKEQIKAYRRDNQA